MRQVFFREAHEKLSPTNTGVMLGQRLQLFVIHPIDVIGAHALRAGELLMLAHGRCGDELTIFPVTAFRADFTNIDFGIKVGGKGITMITTVHIDDVQRMHLIEIVLA